MPLNERSQAIENRVQQERLRRNWSVAELARRAGLNRGTVWLLERRTGQNPTARTMDALAAALEVDRAWLFYVAPSGPVSPDVQADNEEAARGD